ncbi:MAG: ATP-dependent protease ATP-binding subunit ClpX [Gammaproteobacteria bacterium]
MTSENNSSEIKCSFCGRRKGEENASGKSGKEEDNRFVRGEGGVYICSPCVSLCRRQLQGGNQPKAEVGLSGLPSPRAIKAELDSYIIGQERAKMILSVAVYNHYKRVLRPAAQNLDGESNDSVELSKTNILLIGPTGSGKTLLAQTLARVLDFPIVIADATTLTESGYVGEDVESVVQKLLQRSNYDAERARRGIVYIDEVDKIARKSENPSITRDVSGEGVQQALLKLIEGTVAAVPPQGGRKHPHQEYVHIDTTDILFICGGAFDGLADIVRRRADVGGRIGFDGGKQKDKPDDDLLEKVEPADLVRYGLIPEFVGRLPVVGVAKSLDEGALADIFARPKNALMRQYREIFAMDGVDISFSEDGIAEIARIATARGTGARGLRAVAEDLLMDTMFRLPELNGRVIVDAAAVRDGKPKLLAIKRRAKSQKAKSQNIKSTSAADAEAKDTEKAA